MSRVQERLGEVLLGIHAELRAEMTEVEVIMELLDIPLPAVEVTTEVEVEAQVTVTREPEPEPTPLLPAAKPFTVEAGAYQRANILRTLRESGRVMTNKELVVAVGIERTAVRAHLVTLMKEGSVRRMRLKRVGATGQAPYGYEAVRTEHHLDEKSRFVLD